MKLRFKFLLLLLPVLLLPSFVKAEERTLTGEWKKIEAGTSIISLEKKGEFIAQLEAKIKALTDASTEDGTVYDYSYSVKRVYEEETKTIETVNVETIFTTREEANKYYNDLEVKGKTNPIVSKTYSENTKEIVCETDCEEEKLEDYVCKASPLDYKEIEKTFTSTEELNNYVPEEVSGYTYVSKSETSSFNVPKTVTIDENYDDETQANTALSNFVGLYGGSGVVTKYRNTAKDVSSTVVGTTQYDDIDVANAAKASLQDTLDAEVFDGEKTAVLRTGSISQVVQYNIEDIVTQTFNSDQEATNYLNGLRSNGYTIDSYTVTPNTVIGTGTVTSGNKLNYNDDSYELPSTTSYVLIKQASEFVVVWTPTELSISAQNNFKATYKTLNQSTHFDSSTDGDIQIKFISGYGTKNLTYLGHSWGIYSFNISSDGTKLIVGNPWYKVSHIVYGATNLTTTKYSLSGKMSRTELKNVWYIDINVLTYGYSYNVRATGTDYDINYKVIYTYKNNINKMNCSIPTYKLSYDIETINTKTLLEIEWFIGSQFLGSGDTKPPVTGLFVETESYTKYFMMSFIGLFALFKSRKYVFNK